MASRVNLAPRFRYLHSSVSYKRQQHAIVRNERIDSGNGGNAALLHKGGVLKSYIRRCCQQVRMNWPAYTNQAIHGFELTRAQATQAHMTPILGHPGWLTTAFRRYK